MMATSSLNELFLTYEITDLKNDEDLNNELYGLNKTVDRIGTDQRNQISQIEENAKLRDDNSTKTSIIKLLTEILNTLTTNLIQDNRLVQTDFVKLKRAETSRSAIRKSAPNGNDVGKSLTNELEYPTPSAKKRYRQYYQITIRNIKQVFQDIR